MPSSYYVQLLVFAVSCNCLLLMTSARKIEIDRETLITAAIQEVRREFSAIQEEVGVPKSQDSKFHAFKKSTPETTAQSKANRKFERMVKLAEKKILRSKRLATTTTTTTQPAASLALAESLATELFRRPGSVLTEQEVERIHGESGCHQTVVLPTSCDTPEQRDHRTPDGTCNNLASPTWGAANTPLRRLIPARYDDGVSRGRGFLQSQGSSLFDGGVFGSPNPSPRVVSTKIIEDRDEEDSRHTHILMQWGQFLDHDMTFVPEFEGACPENCTIGDEFEGSCFPFAVPEEDQNITTTLADSKRCHAFKRSLGACPAHDLPANQVPARQQLNAITHFIDGSMIYGHSADTLNELRNLSSDAGLLKTGSPASVGSQRPLLPDAESGSFVACPESAEPCFLAGDFRVNEHSALTAMHTLWLREHNRVAQAIRDNNPGYTSDRVFNVARHIVVAEIQKITYDEYLPALLGSSHSALIPRYRGYDDATNPGIPNAFSAAAYRFGHSQIQPAFDMYDSNYKLVSRLSLVDAFFDTSHIRRLGTDPILRGLVRVQAQGVDEFMSDVLTNHLFADGPTSPGLDLASLNIQRGRDHGLPTYLTWKQWAGKACEVVQDSPVDAGGDVDVGGGDQLFRSTSTLARLLGTYGSLDTVDLFVGGLAETPLPGSVVGHTFACIFAKTFIGLRDGDRFFYDNADSETALFSAEQREELSKASLARVICDNTDIAEIQGNAFLSADSAAPCSELGAVDLTQWTDWDPCYIKVESGRKNDNVYYYSTSQRVSEAASSDDSYDFHQLHDSGSGEICLPIKCPQQGGETVFAVGSFENSNCAPERNPSLPATLDELPGKSIAMTASVYIQQLDALEFSQDGNGIYTSLDGCNSGTHIGLDYSCYRRSNTRHRDGD